MRPRTILLVAAMVTVVGGIFAWREYAREHKDTASHEAVHILTAPALLSAFLDDETAAMVTYVSDQAQVIQVDGTIRSMEPSAGGKVNVVLETGDPLAGVVCEFKEADVPDAWRAGAPVSVKGVCSGMLMDVVLIRCAAVN